MTMGAWFFLVPPVKTKCNMAKYHGQYSMDRCMYVCVSFIGEVIDGWGHSLDWRTGHFKGNHIFSINYVNYIVLKGKNQEPLNLRHNVRISSILIIHSVMSVFLGRDSRHTSWKPQDLCSCCRQ